MKVTIDTKEDSREDIEKVLQLLAGILKNGPSSEADVEGNANLMGMFDQDTSANILSSANFPSAKESPAQYKIPDTPPNFPDLIKLTADTQKNSHKSYPRIELF